MGGYGSRIGARCTRWSGTTGEIELTNSQTRLHARRQILPRGDAEISALIKQRARGMPGARCRRSLECAGVVKKSKHPSIHSGSTGISRHPPRNGFTTSFALFPGTIGCVDLVGPLVPRLAARLGSTRHQRTLTPTMGRQNHATSPPATTPLVSHAATAHDLHRPAIAAHTTPSRPPQPTPRS